MDYVEVEGKTYEEAVKKATTTLKVEEKDLDIDVKEIDTRGILGLLGSKKVRITAKVRTKEETPEEYGVRLLSELAKFIDVDFNIRTQRLNDRLIFFIKSEEGNVFIGKDGEVLEALQYILRLALAKRFKQGLKLLIDINDYREKRKRSITLMAKRLAERVKKTGKTFKTEPLNPYERRIIHTFFKHNKYITTKSEGEGYTKKVIISMNRSTNASR